ncbi:MAG: hypothetical protein HY953_05665 [Candidatus Rokubacteria bacterium]|nr:hypothetical protein [Candidatus Rokubacteria bacterium]
MSRDPARKSRLVYSTKILYTPTLIVPSLDPGARARILEAAGPGTVLVEAKVPERQRAEIVDADILFGRVLPDIYVLNRRLRYYQSITRRAAPRGGPVASSPPSARTSSACVTAGRCWPSSTSARATEEGGRGS